MPAHPRDQAPSTPGSDRLRETHLRHREGHCDLRGLKRSREAGRGDSGVVRLLVHGGTMSPLGRLGDYVATATCAREGSTAGAARQER